MRLVNPVDPLTLLKRWPLIEPLVESVLRRGASFRTPDVFDNIHRGFWQLWVDDDYTAMCITSIENYPLSRECLIRYAAGDMETIMEGIPALKAWCRQQQCTKLKCYGRKGWERQLGWPIKHVVLEVDLSDA